MRALRLLRRRVPEKSDEHTKEESGYRLPRVYLLFLLSGGLSRQSHKSKKEPGRQSSRVVTSYGSEKVTVTPFVTVTFSPPLLTLGRILAGL
jgi:hypothetical protein